MFDHLKELWRESLALAKLQKELAALIPEEAERRELYTAFDIISKNVKCPHNQSHILTFVTALLRLPPQAGGGIVEAGCFKGGSTAKFSLIARRLGRPLVVFDSFEGLPDNSEKHDRTIWGNSIRDWFKPKEFCGSLEEVTANVKKYGEIDVCRFEKGWFEDTMPRFTEKVSAVYLDVDLASSTRTCLKYLYPKIVPGGVLVSQDGDFPLVIEVFDDDDFWRKEIGCVKPKIEGLHESKMITIVKPAE